MRPREEKKRERIPAVKRTPSQRPTATWRLATGRASTPRRGLETRDKAPRAAMKRRNRRATHGHQKHDREAAEHNEGRSAHLRSTRGGRKRGSVRADVAATASHAEHDGTPRRRRNGASYRRQRAGSTKKKPTRTQIGRGHTRCSTETRRHAWRTKTARVRGQQPERKRDRHRAGQE